jgi:hypothetical protein
MQTGQIPVSQRSSAERFPRLERHHGQTRYQLEVSKIAGSNTVIQVQGSYSNQKIGEWKANSFGLVLTIDLPGAKRNRYSDRKERQRREQFLNEFLSPRSSLPRIGTGRTMGLIRPA